MTPNKDTLEKINEILANYEFQVIAMKDDDTGESQRAEARTALCKLCLCERLDEIEPLTMSSAMPEDYKRFVNDDIAKGMQSVSDAFNKRVANRKRELQVLIDGDNKANKVIRQRFDTIKQDEVG